MPVPNVKAGDPLGPWTVDVQRFLQEVENRLAEIETPTSPKPAFTCLQADLPVAADFRNCVAYVSNIPILAASDGTVWRRQDTGAAL